MAQQEAQQQAQAQAQVTEGGEEKEGTEATEEAGEVEEGDSAFLLLLPHCEARN